MLKALTGQFVFIFLMTSIVMNFTGAHSDKEIYLNYIASFEKGFFFSGFGFAMDFFVYFFSLIGLSTNAIYVLLIFVTIFLMTQAFRFLNGHFLAIFIFILISSESGNLFGNAIRHGLAGALILYSCSLFSGYRFWGCLLAISFHISAFIYIPFLFISKLSSSNRFLFYLIMLFAVLISLALLFASIGTNSDEHILVIFLLYVFGDKLLTINNLSYAPTYVLYRFYSAGLLLFSIYWIFAINDKSLPKGNIPRVYIEMMLVGNLFGLLFYFLFFGIGASGRILLIPIFFSTLITIIFIGNFFRPLIIQPHKLQVYLSRKVAQVE